MAYLEWLCEHAGMIRIGVPEPGEPYTRAVMFKRLSKTAIEIKGLVGGPTREELEEAEQVMRQSGLTTIVAVRRRPGGGFYRHERRLKMDSANFKITLSGTLTNPAKPEGKGSTITHCYEFNDLPYGSAVAMQNALTDNVDAFEKTLRDMLNSNAAPVKA